MNKFILTCFAAALIITGSSYSQYAASRWIPLADISDRHDYVHRFAIANDGSMYITARTAVESDMDTFSVFVLLPGELRVRQILDVAQPGLYWSGQQHLQTQGSTAFLAASNGLTVFRDGALIHHSTDCIPYRGFRYITATNENEVFISSTKVIDTVGQDKVADVFIRHKLDGCEEMLSFPFSFWRGSDVGIGRNALGQTLIHYTAARPANDTVFYRLDGVGVPSDLRTVDREFDSEYFTGYENGWIVVGEWSRTLLEGVAKLNSDLRVVDSATFPRWVPPYPSLKVRVLDSEDKILYVCTRHINIIDKATLEMTRFVFDEWDRGEGAEFGTEMVDAAFLQGKFYVATDKGIREFTKTPVGVRTDVTINAGSSSVLVSDDMPAISIRNCHERELSVYDLLGRHQLVSTVATPEGVSIDATSFQPGLSVVVLPNGRSYTVLRQP